MSALRVYEVVVIVAPNATDEALETLSTNLANIITTQGGTITKNEKWGKRMLAYPINKFKDGHYLYMELEGTGSEIAEMERRDRKSVV